MKLTNNEIANFLDPAIGELINDKSRRFPITDVFRISSLMDKIQNQARIYQKCARECIEACGGNIDEKGAISFRSLADRSKLDEELKKLGSVKVTIEGEKIKWEETWPELSIREASILKPIIENG